LQDRLDRTEFGLQTDEIRERERWARIVTSVLDDVCDREATFSELFAHFARPEAWTLSDDARTTIDQILARGYRAALASNYDRRLREVAQGFHELQRLEPLFISSEIGWRKPAGAFFDSVARGLGQPHAAVLHVGDNLNDDYEGARAAGLTTLLYDPRGLMLHASVDRISTLGELIHRLPALDQDGVDASHAP
jgi:putative hydrolase of the HAD superfamily